jgi:serpin B
MNRAIFYSIALLALAIAVPSCEKSDPDEKETKKIVLTEKSAQIIEADQAFGFELFREVYSLTGEENIMISPLSVSYALGMTYNGAAGSTLEAFNDVLHFEGLSTSEVNESYKDLMGQLVQLDEQVEFSIANSIWYRMGFPVLPAFLQANRDYFDAEVREVDFTDPATVDIINGWIEEKTNDKIKDMLDNIPTDAVMYLVNAIYFNAKWKYEFEKDKTYEGGFILEDGTIHTTDFMRVSGNFAYTANADFTAVELPYGDSAFSMVVMLPSPEKDLSELVAGLDAARWNEWFANSGVTGVQVDLPKFKYEFKDLMNDPLTNLGLGVAFSDLADFTGINPEGGLMISRVIHQTFIDVQEEGTEAAAATIVEIVETSTGGGGPVLFRVDRPFLYLIKENSTGAIVFIGKVGRPEHP